MYYCQLLPKDASKKFVATGISVFDFEFFIDNRCDFLGHIAMWYAKPVGKSVKFK
jgi:hypothetical protein